MSKATISVSGWVDINYDPARFTDEFMEEFREHFYDYDTIEEHLEHIAYNYFVNGTSEDDFLEGYGVLKDFGIKFIGDHVATEVMPT